MIADLWVVSGKRALGTKMLAVTIPSFMPALPPLLPLGQGRPFCEELQLLMWPYGFQTVHNYDRSKGINFDKYDPRKPNFEYTYVTNTNGRLEKMLKKKVSVSGVSSPDKEFIFIYE